MSTMITARPIGTALVTGATGLLGNNLVRELVARGIRVKAVARSAEKARRQLADVPVEVVAGDLSEVSGFAEALTGVDTIFHTAAHFRDSYKGGKHWDELYRINVRGTEDLLARAYRAGVRQFVHASSIATVTGEPGALIHEEMRRDEKDADDYYRSKILSDRAVEQFLAQHKDFFANFVLPGWMFGPGDLGPTSSGQMVQDFVNGKLPGVVPGSFSVVDARDVAQAMIAAVERGGRGARYLAAGRHQTMAELMPRLEAVSGVKAPTRAIPMGVLYALGALSELWARVSGAPVLLSLATVKLMAQENDRSHYDHAKSERELGLRFRPVDETLADVVAYYRSAGILKSA